jgi:hypothetical protein
VRPDLRARIEACAHAERLRGLLVDLAGAADREGAEGLLAALPVDGGPGDARG